MGKNEARKWSGLRFGANLKIQREQRGWTQEQLAAKLRDAGIQAHWSTIGKIENGDRSVRVDEAAAIADLFDGMSIDALVGRRAVREADTVFALRRGNRLVTQVQWENETLARDLRACAEELEREYPNIAEQLNMVADATAAAVAAAEHFGGIDGAITEGSRAALQALYSGDGQ